MTLPRSYREAVLSSCPEVENNTGPEMYRWCSSTVQPELHAWVRVTTAHISNLRAQVATNHLGKYSREASPMYSMPGPKLHRRVQSSLQAAARDSLLLAARIERHAGRERGSTRGCAAPRVHLATLEAMNVCLCACSPPRGGDTVHTHEAASQPSEAASSSARKPAPPGALER